MPMLYLPFCVLLEKEVDQRRAEPTIGCGVVLLDHEAQIHVS